MKTITALPTDCGLTIGAIAGEPAGFHGASVQQRSGAAQAAVINSTGGASSNANLQPATNTLASDMSTVINDNFTKIAILLNELRAGDIGKGIIKGS